jgi:hypothetical protein
LSFEPLASFQEVVGGWFGDTQKNIGDAWQSTLQWGYDVQQTVAGSATSFFLNPTVIMVLIIGFLLLVLFK